MIIGTQNPVVGREEMYRISDGLNIQTPNQQYFWFLWRKVGGKWVDITKEPMKTGMTATFKFGEKVVGIEFKIEVYKSEKVPLTNRWSSKKIAELHVVPTGAKVPEIQKVVLFNQGKKDPNKATYKDTLIARAYCTGMFNQTVIFNLWEDDAKGLGHNPAVNKNNALPQNFTAKVDKNGIAEVKISLLSNASVLKQIANRFNNPEGAAHEYYVTARYDGKIKGASKVNVNVANPDQGKQLPTATRQPQVQQTKKTKEHSAIFPGTSRVPARPAKDRQITHAYFVDMKGNPVIHAKAGDSLRVRIRTENMKGEKLQFVVWEHDMSGRHDKVAYSGAITVPENGNMNTASFTITQKRYNLGIDLPKFDPDAEQQQYFIEVIPLTTKAKSVKFGISDEDKRMKVSRSPAVVKERTEKKEEKICDCQKYDLIWGGHKNVECSFRKKVVEICANLWGEQNKINMANNLMAVFKWESGGTFKPDAPNQANSGGTGLIQFMPDIARKLLGREITIETVKNYWGKKYNKKTKTYEDWYLKRVKEFADMTALQQLEYVKKYFEPLRGKKVEFVDFYLQVLFPASSGKEEHIVLLLRWIN